MPEEIINDLPQCAALMIGSGAPNLGGAANGDKREKPVWIQGAKVNAIV